MDRVIARVSIAVIKRHNQKPLGKGPSPSPTQAPVFMGFIAPGDATSKQLGVPGKRTLRRTCGLSRKVR